MPTKSAISRLTAAASHDLRQYLQTVCRLQAPLARTQNDTNSVALLEETARVMDKTLAEINGMKTGITEEMECPS